MKYKPSFWTTSPDYDSVRFFVKILEKIKLVDLSERSTISDNPIGHSTGYILRYTMCHRYKNKTGSFE